MKKKAETFFELPPPSERTRLGLRNSGGVALEYIMVTTFALATTLLALGYLSKTVKTRFAELEATSLRSGSGESLWDP